MSVALRVPDQLASRIAVEAAKRDLTPEELLVRAVEEYIPERPILQSFLGMGESAEQRDGADLEATMAARGFGR